VVVIGPSGSGKSTLLRCLNGLEDIDSGSIVIDSVPLDNSRSNRLKIREEVGMVFQSFNLFPHMTVTENINLAQRLVRKKSKKEAMQTTMSLLEKIGIPEKASSYPSQLSGGQQQRVAIARALAMMPKAKLLQFNEEPQLYQELLNGNIHAVVASLPMPAYQALKYPDKLFAITEPFTKELIGFAVRKGDYDTINYFNSWIRQVDAEGFLKERHNYRFNTREWDSLIK